MTSTVPEEVLRRTALVVSGSSNLPTSEIVEVSAGGSWTAANAAFTTGAAGGRTIRRVRLRVTTDASLNVALRTTVFTPSSVEVPVMVRAVAS